MKIAQVTGTVVSTIKYENYSIININCYIIATFCTSCL